MTPPITVNKWITQGRGLSRVLLQRATSVSLASDVRRKSHFHATDSQGRALEVHLPHGAMLRGDDVLVADDGSLIVVQAAAQPVLLVTPCAEHGSGLDLLRAAYHLGRHRVPLALTPDHLKLEPDPALAALLRQMHLTVTPADAPFEPEADLDAAMSAPTGHDHGCAHGHDHGHDHHHSHADAEPSPKVITVHGAAAPHVHGPGCQHDH